MAISVAVPPPGCLRPSALTSVEVVLLTLEIINPAGFVERADLVLISLHCFWNLPLRDRLLGSNCFLSASGNSPPLLSGSQERMTTMQEICMKRGHADSRAGMMTKETLVSQRLGVPESLFK